MDNSHKTLKQNLKDRVESFTGESVALCYQCGKCAAGCPLIDEMDIAPNQVLRMLQLGLPNLEEKVLKSESIWLCLSCETCVSRCPKDVDIPVIMDYLRSESREKNMVNPKAKDILSFHKAFLDSIKYFGKLSEVGLIADYKMRTFHLIQDVILAPKMFVRGKLKLVPSMLKNQDAIKRIFERTIEEKNK